MDITKDRLYCDAKDSPRRRATQAVMREAFEHLAALLAPVLAFTADEAWEFAGHAGSVHLELFPEVDEAARDHEVLEAHVEYLLKLRGGDRAGHRAGAPGKAHRQCARRRL